MFKESINIAVVNEELIHSCQIDYFSTEWDTMKNTLRESVVLEQAKTTAIFAREAIPFYREHFKKFSQKNIQSFGSLEEFGCILPETSRDHLSKNSLWAFVPEIENNKREWDNNKGLFRNKGTGGTTGKPITILYSTEDWRAMAQHIARSIKFDFRDSLNQLFGMKVLGLYHGDHITNEIYQSGLSLLGVQLFNRVSTKNDITALYNFLQELKPNAILAPPEDGKGNQTKGSTLDSILKLDAKNSNPKAYRLHHDHNPDFKAIFWSSMPISTDLQNYILNHLKLPYQQAQFGSTEVCPTGATCTKYPRDFHLGFGPTLTLVKHTSNKRLCKENEVGRVIVSKTGSTTAFGKNIVPTGTVLLNYSTGDYATVINTNGKVCECGRNTPILFDVHRINYIESKAMFGCQAD